MYYDESKPFVWVAVEIPHVHIILRYMSQDWLQMRDQI